MGEYVLHWQAGFGSMVVDAALRMAGAPVRHVRVDTAAKEHKSPAFLAMNPMGQVPTLVLPDGTVMSETSAMVLVIDEAYPGKGILPLVGTPERAISLRWLMFLAAAVYPAELRSAYPERFTTATDDASLAAVKASGDDEANRELIMFANAMTGTFLIGETMTITDVYAQMLIDWQDPKHALSPKFGPQREGILRHAGVAAAWRFHEFS